MASAPMQPSKSPCIINLETYPSRNSPTVTGDEAENCERTERRAGEIAVQAYRQVFGIHRPTTNLRPVAIPFDLGGMAGVAT
jgi:hypothetical protein